MVSKYKISIGAILTCYQYFIHNVKCRIICIPITLNDAIKACSIYKKYTVLNQISLTQIEHNMFLISKPHFVAF